MKKFRKALLSFFCILLAVLSTSTTAFSHSGRTDSSGGHNDNKNKSGLGGYHYHCGGYPVHLHEGGYCPYTDVFPSGVTISVEKSTLGIGEKVSISGAVSPSNSCNTYISWSCSDPNVVRLADGVIEAVGYGTATITATTFNEKVGSVTITVKEITADQVIIHDTVESLYIGENVKLSAEIVPPNVDNPSIQWTTSDAAIATVDETGFVNAIASGTVVISAIASNGVTGEYVLAVQEKYVESIEILENDLSLFLGDTIELKAKVLPEDATNPAVTWSSNAPAVVEIKEDGTVHAVGCGNAIITVTSSNALSDSISVTVDEIVAEKVEIEVEPTIILGETAQASVIFYPKDTTVQEIQWSVNDEKIASIDENGLIQTHQIGEFTITASQKDVTNSVEVQVVPRLVENIEITSSLGDSLHVGDISDFSAEVSPENATYQDISWKSSNTDVAVIDENGKLEAKSLGKAVITASTQDGYVEEYEIEVVLTTQSVLLLTGGVAGVGAGGIVFVRKKKEKKKAAV